MTAEQIINEVLPITAADKKCRFKMQHKNQRRQRLAVMLQQYKAGNVVNWEPLKISVDIAPFLQRLNN